MIRALIVEDSRLARLELRSQLAQVDGIECVGEAEDVATALSLYQSLQPTLVFLDIDLPDGTGFDFLTRLDTVPYVIFVTAYKEFAHKAFEQDAVDYLLKPFTQARLNKACEKLKGVLNSEALAQPKEDKMVMDSQFFVKDGTKCWLINLQQVERFEAMGNYTRVHCDDKRPMVYRTLAQIEQRLPETDFFRISRQHIIQLKLVVEVQSCSSGGLELTLRSGAKVEVSRRQASVFKSLLAL
jgi:two-component system LytT family response regulator